MKKHFCMFLIICLLIFSFPTQAEETVSGLSKNLIILFTSDVHCGIDNGWGYAGLYQVKQMLMKENNVLLVDNGDALQGELVGLMTTGEAIIEIMNTLGYDAAIPGNHDFDYGVDRFLELTRKANFPYICCNFRDKTGSLLFPPYLILEVEGTKIGFVGICTPDTLRSSTPKFFQNDQGEFIYSFDQDRTGEALYTTVQQTVDDVRAAGADYVIVLGHLGNHTEYSPWMYSEVIEHTSGIDALLDGHSHDTEKVIMKNRDGKDVLRIACGTKMQNIGALTITPAGEITAELYHWDTSIAAPELMELKNQTADAVNETLDQLSGTMDHVIAHTNINLVIYDPTVKTEEGEPVRIIRNTETNLGDLITDALRDRADADIAFANAGGLRADLKAGDITYRAVKTVFPFDNDMAVIEVSGAQVLDALEWSVHSLPDEFGGFLQISGISFRFDPTIVSPCVQDDNGMFDHITPDIPRRVQSVMVNGEPLDLQKTYRLAGIDYLLLNDGDGYTMFRNSTVVAMDSQKADQILIEYITHNLNGTIGEEYANPYGQERIVSVTADK